MDDKIKLLINTVGEHRIKTGEKLSYHTFAKVGGEAEYFYIATSINELTSILDNCYELQIPFFLLGGGTKILVPEEGIPGLIIKNRTSHIKVSSIKGKVGKLGIGVDEVTLEVDSGVSLGKFNEYLEGQQLKEVKGYSSKHSSLGGAIFIDPGLKNVTGAIKVWHNGEVFIIDSAHLRREYVVLSLTLKIKSVV